MCSRILTEMEREKKKGGCGGRKRESEEDEGNTLHKPNEACSVEPVKTEIVCACILYL